MLKKSNVTSVIDLAAALTDSGKMLGPKPTHTILDNVLRAVEVNHAVANDLLEDTLVNRSNTQVVPEGVVGEEGKIVVIPNAHTQDMDALTTAAASGIRKIAELVRTHINPAVRKISSEIQAEIEGNVYLDVTDFGYETFTYNQIYNSGLVEGMVSSISPNRGLEGLSSKVLPNVDAAFLESLVANGNGDITAGINTFTIDNKDGLSHVYNLFFQDGVYNGEGNPLAGTVYTKEGKRFINVNTGNLDVIAVGLIMGVALLETVPPGTQGSLDEYTASLYDTVDDLKVAVGIIIERRNNEIGDKILVRSWPTINAADFKVSGLLVLNNDSISEYWDSSLCMDHLIGSALSSQANTVETLLAQKDELERVYKNHLENARLSRQINRQRFLTVALIRSINDYFEETDESIFEPSLVTLELANKYELRDVVLAVVRDDCFNNRVDGSCISEYLNNLFGRNIFVNPSLADFLYIFNNPEQHYFDDDNPRSRATATAIIMMVNMFAEGVAVSRI